MEEDIACYNHLVIVALIAPRYYSEAHQSPAHLHTMDAQGAPRESGGSLHVCTHEETDGCRNPFASWAVFLQTTDMLELYI